MIAAIDAEIAMIAPTDRSTPPVAITSVMPMASSMIVDPLRRMSTRFPNRWPSTVSSAKKPGTAIRSKRRIMPRAMSGNRTLLSPNRRASDARLGEVTVDSLPSPA